MSASPVIVHLTVAASALVVGAATATTLQQLPKGAHAGECFSRVTTSAIYRTEQTSLAQPPLVSWRDVPAVYRTTTRKILVSAGRLDHQTIPAVIGTRVRWVEHPGQDRVVDAPAIYRWVDKRILVSPARLEWKRGSTKQGYASPSEETQGGYARQSLISPTGEVLCRVRVPARYKVRRVRVLVSPARTCIVRGPSSRERVVEHFVLSPAHNLDRKVAPIYRTVTDHILVSPARREKVVTPQPPRVTQKRVLVTPAHSDWKHIVCALPVAGSQPKKERRIEPAQRGSPARPTQQSGAAKASRKLGYGVHLQPGDQGYGQAPIYLQDKGGARTYVPDYARPRPGQLQGAPSQPAYHAPRANPGDPSY